jgi:hypothetical protein
MTIAASTILVFVLTATTKICAQTFMCSDDAPNEMTMPMRVESRIEVLAALMLPSGLNLPATLMRVVD